MNTIKRWGSHHAVGRNRCIVLFKCNFRDLDLMCGLNLKPFHSGESVVVWIKSLVVQVKVSWRCSRVLFVRSLATSSSGGQCDGGGGADLDIYNCRLRLPSVRDRNAIVKLWWCYGIINSISLLDLAVVMSSQNKSSLHSIIAKGVKIGTDPLLPQNSH